ncbi:hypothetical protein SRHO_G00130760 [Serrasalmus rhombeus]
MDPVSSATLKKAESRLFGFAEEAGLRQYAYISSPPVLLTDRAGKRGGDGEKLGGRAEGSAELRDNVPQRRRNSLSLRQPNSALAPSNGAGTATSPLMDERETERDGGGREDGSEGGWTRTRSVSIQTVGKEPAPR